MRRSEGRWAGPAPKCKAQSPLRLAVAAASGECLTASFGKQPILVSKVCGFCLKVVRTPHWACSTGMGGWPFFKVQVLQVCFYRGKKTVLKVIPIFNGARSCQPPTKDLCAISNCLDFFVATLLHTSIHTYIHTHTLP